MMAKSQRVLWGKAARATRAVSAGMVSRGWEGRDIRLFLTSRYGKESLTRAIGAAPAMDRMPIASSQRESVPSPRLFWYLGELGNSIRNSLKNRCKDTNETIRTSI